MQERCPDKVPKFLETPEVTHHSCEGGEFMQKRYRDGVTVWISMTDGEAETRFLGGDRHYDNPDTKEIHFIEQPTRQELGPPLEEI